MNCDVLLQDRKRPLEGAKRRTLLQKQGCVPICSPQNSLVYLLYFTVFLFLLLFF